MDIRDELFDQKLFIRGGRIDLLHKMIFKQLKDNINEIKGEKNE